MDLNQHFILKTDPKSTTSTIPPKEFLLKIVGFEPTVLSHSYFQNKYLRPLSHIFLNIQTNYYNIIGFLIGLEPIYFESQSKTLPLKL